MRRPGGSGPTGSPRTASSRCTSTLRPAELVRALGGRAPSRSARRVGCSTCRRSASSPWCGPDAERVLNRICANDVAVPVGTDRLHPVAQRAGHDRGRPHRHPRGGGPLPGRHRGSDPGARPRLAARPHPVGRPLHGRRTSRQSMAVLSVMGPQLARAAAGLTDADLGNEHFPFGTSRVIDLGYARVRASRITYVGELGLGALRPDRVRRERLRRHWRTPGAAIGLTALRLPRARTRCAWRRAIATGATTSPRTRLRSRQGSGSRWRGTSRADSSDVRRWPRAREEGLRQRLVQVRLLDDSAALPQRADLAR